MKGFTSCALIALFLCGALAASSGTCTISASLAARAGSSWTDGSGNKFQIFDITITNTGTCSFSQASLTLTLPAGNTVWQAWNYDASTKALSNFGTLQAGSSFNAAGVVIQGGGVPTVASATATCDSTCTGPTSAPTSGPTSAPTSGPTSAPTSGPTSAPTSGPTSAPTSTPSPIDTNCQLSVSQTRRTAQGSSWTTGDNNFQIYDVTFTNSGSETLTFAQFDEGLGVGTPVSFWGLIKVCCTQIDSAVSYNVTLPTGGLAVGQSIGAGFILEYPTTATLVDPEFASPIVQTQFFDFVECARS